jgi:hypothetical protein
VSDLFTIASLVIRRAEELRFATVNTELTYDAVTAWQSDRSVRPLTCGKRSRHRPLVPIVSVDRVQLWCLDCDYIQEYVPDAVMRRYGDRSEAVTDGRMP